MSLIFNLYDTTIPDADIISYPVSDEQINFGNTSSLIASSLDIILDNTDKSKYDDRTAGSLFYGSDWYNQDAYIYNDETNLYMWKGRIKNIKINDQDSTLTVTTYNYIKDLTKIPCIYTNNSDKTGAEIVYEIITDIAGIDSSNILYTGFQDAINIQDTNSVYFNVNYAEKDNAKCLQVISEICRITNSHLYTDKNNQLCFYQWQEYNGTTGQIIEDSNLIEKSYEHEFIEDTIFNSYSIKYSGINVATGSDSTSITKYGKSSFVVPSKKMDSTTDSDYKILLRNLTGAEYCGDLALTRYKNIKKKFKMKVGEELSHLQLLDQIDLNFDDMIREPAVILSRNFNREERTIEFQGEFLNTPYQYYSRDITPPDPVTLHSVLPLPDGGLLVKFTESQESDHLGYSLYFTATRGEWKSEISNLGISPVDLKNNSKTNDGYCYQKIYELNNGTKYFFKLKSYDTSFNPSVFSNVKNCNTYNSSLENKYYCSGDPYIDGITIATSNSGSVPTDWTNLYGTGTYGSSVYEYIGCYESGIHFNPDEWSSILIKTITGSSLIFQYRSSSDGTSWGSWSTKQTMTGQQQFSLTGKYVQYRISFSATDRESDSSHFYIYNLE